MKGSTKPGLRDRADKFAHRQAVQARLLEASTAGRHWILAVGVVALALAVRLAVAWAIEDLPLSRTPKLDSLEYLSWAQSIAAGESRWPNPPPHGPGYPYALAFLLRSTPGSLHDVRIAQATLGTLSVALVMLMAARVFSWSAGMTAGVFQALYGPLVYLETSLYAEGLFVLLLTAALYSYVRLEQHALLRGSLTGLCLGLASVTRPTALVLVPVLGITLLVGRSRRAVLAAVLLLAASAAIVLPVVLKNVRDGGGTLIQAHGGMNFYLGNNPDGNGLASARLGGTWDRMEAEAARAGIARAADQDSYYFRKSLSLIRERPARWLRLLASKAVWLVAADEVRDSHSFYFFREHSTVLKWLPGFGTLLAFAAWGFWQSRERRRIAPLVAYLVAMAFTSAALVVGLRYRLPLVPMLAVFAGHGLVSLIRLGRARRARTFVTGALVVATILGASHLRRHEPSHNFAEEWAFTGGSLVTERRLDEAEAAYRRALTLDASLGTGWDGLGLVYLNQGALLRAREALLRSLSLDSDNIRARYHLGLVEDRSDRQAAAIDQFRRALAINPLYLDARRALAAALAGSGRGAEAAREYAAVLARAPDDSGSLVELARLKGEMGQPTEGIDLAMRALAIDRADASTWILLAHLSIDAGRPDAAEAAVERAAGQVGPDAAPVAVARARILAARGRHQESYDALVRLLRSNPQFLPAVKLLYEEAMAVGRVDEARWFVETLSMPRKP